MSKHKTTQYNRYKGGKISKVTRSMRCLECNSLRFVHLNELHRAAQPHCMKCGGPLEEIDVSRKRWELPPQIELSKELNQRKKRSEENKIRCLGCGMSFAKPCSSIGKDLSEYLSVHLQGNRACCDAYVEENELVNINQLTLAITPTLFADKIAHDQYGVIGITPSGERMIFFCVSTRHEVEESLNDLIGGDMFRQGI